MISLFWGDILRPLLIREPKAEDVLPGIEVPGLYAFFVNPISKIKINILDILSPGSTFMLIIAEADLIRAYAALSGRIRQFRKDTEVRKRTESNSQRIYIFGGEGTILIAASAN